MLARAARVRKSDEFTAVAASARPVRGEYLQLRSIKSPGQPRFGFIVSTRVSPLAVVRNVIKRRLRAIIRQHYGQIRPNTVTVITARPPAARASHQDLRTDTETLLARANLLET